MNTFHINGYAFTCENGIVTITNKGVIVKHLNFDNGYVFCSGTIFKDRLYLAGYCNDGSNDIPVVAAISSRYAIEMVAVVTDDYGQLLDITSDDEFMYAVGYSSDSICTDHSAMLIKIDVCCNIVKLTKHAAGKSTLYSSINSIRDEKELIMGKMTDQKIIEVSGCYYTSKYRKGELSVTYANMEITKRTMDTSYVDEVEDRLYG